MSYLKDHLCHISAIIILMILEYFMGIVFFVDESYLTAQIVLNLIVFTGMILYDYFRKIPYYHKFEERLQELDQKYLIIETMQEPSFYEGKIMYYSLYQINKSMNEKIRNYRREIDDFKDYIEMWIHEVKTPISSLSLMFHNLGNMRAVYQLKKIENYTQQVLYYLRSQSTTQDYIIREVSLDECVNHVLVKNKDELLGYHFQLKIDHLSSSVMSDNKWLEFIINQIISNSMKYRSDFPYIKISCKEDAQQTVLSIYDNGIGIKSSDLPLIFNKSYTGMNGHIETKATGMGLFIVKKLCDALGHEIKIESKEKQYTLVNIIFHKNDYYVTKL
ncbi:MAG: sensor histidine kinase [Eggerthia catenaformis]|uniref:sensor histidine kinase n=1 Tax=Eggerthia catenaformis TaxID=31973 RepID=UPI003F9EE058